MSKEFSLTERQIFQAENKRAKGYLARAIEITNPINSFPLENFNRLDEDDKTRFLMATRINVVAKTSQAKQSFLAESVATHLKEAKNTIINVYRNPQVEEFAKTRDHDTVNSPYEFSTEMIGDEVSYMLTLAALTANPELVHLAIKKLDNAIAIAKEDTVRTMLDFNKVRLQNNILKYPSSFELLKYKFQETVQASLRINRHERASTLAARYSVDALKHLHPIEALKGVAVCVKSAFSDKSTITILPRVYIKELSQNLKTFIWHKTIPKGADYSKLEI